MKSDPHLLVLVATIAAAGAGLISAAALFVNSRSAAANDAIVRRLQVQGESLSELNRQVAELARSRSEETRTSRSPRESGQAPVAPSASVDNVEKIAAAVADRVAERTQAESLPRTDENVAAFDQGTRVIQAAVESGHWTEREFTAMHRLMGKLHPEDVVELSHRLAVEINAGRVHPELRSQLF